MKCQHPGCQRSLVTDCISPKLSEINHFDSLDDYIQAKLIEEGIKYYCPEHCQQYGYCWNCGTYQADRNDIKFRKTGLCRQCSRDNDSA